jgi:hypothetical protein
MTDLEESCWSTHLCQNCGSQLREKHPLKHAGKTEFYCSLLCYEVGVKQTMVSAPVFVAPGRMDLRAHLRRALQDQ